MGRVDLRRMRERQIERQKEAITIPPGIIDPVLYAHIERDYAELLKIVIDDTPLILEDQLIYFIGKSESQGRRIIRRMLELGILGVKEWRGVNYYYTLSKAKAWREGIPKDKARSQRTDYADETLFRHFMKNEMIIYRDKVGMASLFDPNEKRIDKIKYEPDQQLRLDGREEKKVKLKKYGEMNEKDFERFKINAHYYLNKYKQEITIYRYTVKQNRFYMMGSLYHHNEMRPTHYFRQIKSIYDFAKRFGVGKINLNFEVLVDKETLKPVALNFAKRGLAILKQEIKNGSAEQTAKYALDNLEVKIDEFNMGLARFYETEEEG